MFVVGDVIASGDAETRIARGTYKPTVFSPSSSIWGRLPNYEADRPYAPDESPSLVRTGLQIEDLAGARAQAGAGACAAAYLAKHIDAKTAAKSGFRPGERLAGPRHVGLDDPGEPPRERKAGGYKAFIAQVQPQDNVALKNFSDRITPLVSIAPSGATVPSCAGSSRTSSPTVAPRLTTRRPPASTRCPGRPTRAASTRSSC